MSRPCCRIARGMGARFCGACGREALTGRRRRIKVHEDALGLSCLVLAALGVLGVFPFIDIVVPVEASVIADDEASVASTRWEEEPVDELEPAHAELREGRPPSGEAQVEPEAAPVEAAPDTEQVVEQLVDSWSGTDGGAADGGPGPGGPARPLAFTTATASAYTYTGGRMRGIMRYAPQRAIDGDRTTGWQVSDGGVGHWLRLELGARSRIDRVGFIVGYDKVRSDRIGDRWPLNNRVSDVLVTWEGGSAIHHFEDDRSIQWVDLGSVTSSWVSIEITGIYPGSRWNDTVISEVQCEGADLSIL